MSSLRGGYGKSDRRTAKSKAGSALTKPRTGHPEAKTQMEKGAGHWGKFVDLSAGSGLTRAAKKFREGNAVAARR
jgi:hypothetical protein